MHKEEHSIGQHDGVYGSCLTSDPMERWRLPVEDTPLEDCTESVLRHWDCLPDLDQSEVSIQLWAPPITAHLACRSLPGMVTPAPAAPAPAWFQLSRL